MSTAANRKVGVGLDEVEKTWAELGYRVRPLRWTIFVRADDTPKKVGSLFLPFKLQTFFGEMAHLQLVTGRVLAVGPKTREIVVGDRVVFQRLHFARYLDLPDKTKIGWIDSNQVLGFPED